MTGVHTKPDGANTWTFKEDTGVLTLAVIARPAMLTWIGGFTVSDPAAGADPDNDGMENLLEFVLNGNPSISDPAILPDLVVTATHYEFTFTRRDDSLAPETTQIFQYGTDLTGWTDVVVPGSQRHGWCGHLRRDRWHARGHRQSQHPEVPCPGRQALRPLESHQALMLDSRPPAPTFTGRPRAAFVSRRPFVQKTH